MDNERFRLQLEKQKGDLEKSVAYLKKSDPYLDKNSTDSGNTLDDDITEIEGHDRITATRLQMKQDLAVVNAALERIEKGKYGVCTNCGENIPPERLEAMPSSELCHSCSSKKR